MSLIDDLKIYFGQNKDLVDKSLEEIEAVLKSNVMHKYNYFKMIGAERKTFNKKIRNYAKWIKHNSLMGYTCVNNKLVKAKPQAS